MVTQPDFNSIFIFLLATIVGLLAWALKRLISIDNGMGQVMAWKQGHEKLDDERAAAVNKSLDAIWKRLDDDYGSGRKG